jgi:5-methylcytosine-specific restriction protein B
MAQTQLRQVARAWWVNQGETYAASRDLGVIFARQVGKDGLPRAHWTDLQQAREGDAVLHYAKGAIQAVSRVLEPSVIEPRPPQLVRVDGNKAPGYLVRADYRELGTPIFRDEIPVGWRIEERGPFDRNGGVRQGYFFRISETFVGQLAGRFPDLGFGAH